MEKIDHEVLDKLDGYDPERGVKVVGHRGYFLRRWGVFLNQYDSRAPGLLSRFLTGFSGL